MATPHSAGKIKSLKVVSDLDPQYQCDVCGSSDVIETREGFTCRACGIVLEIQKLEYHRPYDADIVQHAVLGKTQIGFRAERRSMQHSARLEGLSKIDASRPSEESVRIGVRVEAKRILTALGFPTSDIELIVRKVKQIRAKLGKGTKYRSPEMLVPCVIYAYYKENNKSIRELDLLEVAKISKNDFNAFKFSIIRIWPEYQERDRKQYITERILEVTEHFELGMPFYYQSERILNRFYEAIKNTKDDVIVGLVTSITLLCSQREDVSVCAICERLGIKMSTIHRQVERKVIQRFKVPGFKSLVKSAELLKNVMGKLGVLDPAYIDLSDVSENVPQCDDIVQVVIGNANPVFNNLNGSEEYYLFVKDSSGYLVASVAKDQGNYITRNYDKSNGILLSQKRKRTEADEVKIELWRYHNATGPPVTC
jgi:hypothetical protein